MSTLDRENVRKEITTKSASGAFKHSFIIWCSLFKNWFLEPKQVYLLIPPSWSRIRAVWVAATDNIRLRNIYMGLRLLMHVLVWLELLFFFLVWIPFRFVSFTYFLLLLVKIFDDEGSTCVFSWFNRCFIICFLFRSLSIYDKRAVWQKFVKNGW